MSQASLLRIAIDNLAEGRNVWLSADATPQISALDKVTAKTSGYTAVEGDFFINCTSGTFTITLPPSISGKLYDIKNSGIGTITVQANGAQTIDGENTQSLIEDESITIIGDGSNWYIL